MEAAPPCRTQCAIRGATLFGGQHNEQVSDVAAAKRTAGGRRGRALAVAGSCHPLPCLAVVGFVTVLTAKAGNGPASVALVAVAVLAGQLSIGWSNDLLDAARDREVGRKDKPLARDGSTRRTVAALTAAALILTIAVSVVIGPRFAVLHLAAVGCGWLYNLGLKSTWWSWLPYALAFGSLPALAAAALPAPGWAAWWALAAGALLGCTAHIANTLPDLADDLRTGVLGFPHRIGAAKAFLVAALALLAGTTTLVFGPAPSPGALRWSGFVVVVMWAVLGTAAALRTTPGRTVFLGALAMAALDLALLASGPSFVR